LGLVLSGRGMSEALRAAIRDGKMLKAAKRRPSLCRKCGDYHAPAERCAPMIGEGSK
jgi:hypothetical protein